MAKKYYGLTSVSDAQEAIESYSGLHPSKGLGKRQTAFVGKVKHVRFDRKTIPKKDEIWIEYKKSCDCYLYWHRDTRALLWADKSGDKRDEILEKWRRYNERVSKGI